MSYLKSLLTIWTKPRETIKELMQTPSSSMLYFLCFTYGLAALLGIFANYFSTWPLYLLFLASFGLAPIYGYLMLSLISAIFYLTGKWLNSPLTFSSIRYAIAWINVPSIIGALLWILFLLVFGVEGFSSLSTDVLHGGSLFLYVCIWIGFFVLPIWTLVLYVQVLSEVQSFSILRSIAHILLVLVMSISVLTLISIIIAAFMGV